MKKVLITEFMEQDSVDKMSENFADLSFVTLSKVGVSK